MFHEDGGITVFELHLNEKGVACFEVYDACSEELRIEQLPTKRRTIEKLNSKHMNEF